MTDIIDVLQHITLPDSASNKPSCYAFSLHKSGSTLLFNILHDLAPHVDLTYFSLQDHLFQKGIRPRAQLINTESLFKETGYIYAGFRLFPKNYSVGDIKNSKKIFLMRNPLDALVSLYFSEKTSHAIPKQGQYREDMIKARKELDSVTIDDFVMSKYQAHLSRIDSYIELMKLDNIKLFRYEDIIYTKRAFVTDICSYFDWEVPEDVLHSIADKYDEFPEEENSEVHVRQVHPDNYKKHLTKQTQQILVDKFEKVFDIFGYEPSISSNETPS